jgi:D-alanyl-D-alanine carboxypeptidase (penicillin-binding protein 5/6)
MHMKIVWVLFAMLFLMGPVRAWGAEPKVVAKGAILVCGESGRVLWAKNADEPLAMASTTKIMTAAYALLHGNMDDTVTVSKRAAGAPRVKMGLSPGEQLRLYSLMQALMLESSNDAAIAVAEHIGGTVEDFCAAMTQLAREIGAENTTFETPSGLDKGDHASTARDLAIITRFAYTVPGFEELINTPHANFRSDRRGYTMLNKNRLLREFGGANGVKTGFTNKAGHCFVGSATQGDMQLISVVLASGWGKEGRAKIWSDTKTILSHGFEKYDLQALITAGDTPGEIALTRAREKALPYEYAYGATAAKSASETVLVQFDLPDIATAPIEKGSTIGTAHVFVGEDLIRSVPLLASADIARHDFITSLRKLVEAAAKPPLLRLSPELLPLLP